MHELVANLNDRLARDASAMCDSLVLMGAVLVTMNAIGEHDEGIKADAMELANALLKAQ